MRVLRTIRGPYGNKTWQRYGFVDAFNPLTNWYDADVLGIDFGITMLMVENHRTGFVWQTFMKNSEAGTAMLKVGFQPDQAQSEQETRRRASLAARGTFIARS